MRVSELMTEVATGGLDLYQNSAFYHHAVMLVERAEFAGDDPVPVLVGALQVFARELQTVMARELTLMQNEPAPRLIIIGAPPNP